MIKVESKGQAHRVIEQGAYWPLMATMRDKDGIEDEFKVCESMQEIYDFYGQKSE